MRRFLRLALVLLTAPRAPAPPLVGVLVSDPGRLDRVAGLIEGLKDYPQAARIEVCLAPGGASHLRLWLRKQGGCCPGDHGGVETLAAFRGTAQVPVRFVGLAASLDWGFLPGSTALAAGRPGIRL